MLHRTTDRLGAFALVELMIVIAILGILLSIAIPSWLSARKSARAKGCIENLSQLTGAITRWSFDEGKSTGDAGPAIADLTDRKYLRSEPRCPDGDVAYVIPLIGYDPVCPSGISGHVLP
ncbi:TPA: competence protein ComG [Candidatus Sumerlaeota bacterium]|jgi:general secretion pathway protein G|nr:competence protein ComG [Candidatus Sumerlaeota bacterium]